LSGDWLDIKIQHRNYNKIWMGRLKTDGTPGEMTLDAIGENCCGDIGDTRGAEVREYNPNEGFIFCMERNRSCVYFPLTTEGIGFHVIIDCEKDKEC
jgi:hypothetical protein